MVHGLDAFFGAIAVAAFWIRLAKLTIAHRRAKEYVCACVDGDCRFGVNDGADAHIGDVLDAPHRHSFVSDASADFCKRTGLYIANTIHRLVAPGQYQGSFFTRLIPVISTFILI